MHEKGQNGANCGDIKREKGIQRLEAMLCAVDSINRDPDILPGLKIGVHILDTCSFDTYALEQCMDFIKAQMTTTDLADYKCNDGQAPKYIQLKPVSGVIGAAASTVSIMVANILRLFKIPQISYASTSIDLSDKSRFEYFSRVVPPDSFQARAMVDIAARFGWNYVSTLADDGNYGEKGVSAFEEIAKKFGICVAQSLKISRMATDEEFDKIVDDLISIHKAKAVVMFVNEDNCRKLLLTLRRRNRTMELTFLASDSWGAKIHPVYGQEIFAEGTLSLLPKRRVIADFDEYFLGLTLPHAQIDPWFSEYWESIFDCTMQDKPNRTRCSGTEDISAFNKAHYEQEGLVQFVIDSVYALAHAVHSLLTDSCPLGPRECLEAGYITGEEVLNYIRNVSFVGIGGDEVKFDSKGDGLGKYDIFQYQHLTGDRYDYVRVGEWIDRLVIFNDTLLFRNRTTNVPRSVCSEECPFGYIKNNTVESDTCCWVCIRCRENQMLKNEYTCQDCPDDYTPNRNLTLCIPLPVMHLNWDSLWVLLPVSVSSLGMLAAGYVIYVFIKFNRTPLIMASGRELCYVLLCGIFMSYGTTFILLAQPTVILCTVKRFMLGISLCLIYASVLVKTNRIYRIFNRGVKAMVKKPSYTSPRSQICICLSLVSVQIVGGLTWIGFEKPETLYVKHYTDFLVLTCKASQIAILLSLVYNMLLIILCTVFGFKTRKIPQNFNEAKYIAFTMYSTCIVWLAFIPIYFGANHDFKIEVTSLCMCVSISATVALVCLFGPKVYIVIFQPHKNVRQGATPGLQAAGRSFAKPFIPSVNSPGALCNASSYASYETHNGHVKDAQKITTSALTTTMTIETVNDVFSDSLEEDDDDFCDEPFIPKPTVDKATSTSEQ
ncbi:metabotropic glutamate receptor 8-like isoform X3 [Mya arenaria]|uniref:metabotropic glutamate receptor 8-like isoform X3 n=2 Tax=Mya arenaria TaxID=6604 RepID=UPI0022E68199|nr:metabotropic glutamate receptor 8-like isoform X3 [Mya arenaria]